MELPTPTLADVLDARRRIAPYLAPTPLRSYAALDDLLGAEVLVKHENHQPTGAFKVRGGINLVSRLTPAERERGVVSASTGNHGQSIAYAARLFSVPATICVPEDPAIEVIGVQSSAAPAAWQSWREGRLVESTMGTFAEGLATRTAFALPQRILRASLDDFVLVDDDAIRSAQRQMIEVTRTLVEAAGAAALAAAVALRDRLQGGRVALVASGGNVTREQLAELLG